MAAGQAGVRFIGDAGVAVLVRKVARHHAENFYQSEIAPGEPGAYLDAFGVGDHG